MDSKPNMEKKNPSRGSSRNSADSSYKAEFGNKKRNFRTKDERNEYGKRPNGAYGGRSGQRIFRTREKMGGEVIHERRSQRNEQRQHLEHLNDWSEPNWSPDDNRFNAPRRKKITHQVYNKDDYLRQNCQFVVHSAVDYSAHAKDPDLMVDWGIVEEVRMHKTDPPNCPVCLYPPIAGQITKCGHVYCYQCILHYLALSDHPWRPCPICEVHITQQDLRSVVIIKHQEFSVGDEICMTLMHRDRDSVIPDLFSKKSEHPFDFSNISDVSPNSMLIVASKQQILQEIIGREQSELNEQLKSNKDEPEACFIQQALVLLKQRKVSVNLYQTCRKKKPPVQQIDQSLQQLNLKEHSLLEDGNTLKTDFQFYQESNGMHIYLNSLNIQMLIKEFGSLEKSPPVVSGVIVQKESEVMTENQRRRTKFLSHLSYGCPYHTVEIRFTQPIISEETLEHLKSRIEKRVQFRRHKEEQEKAAEVKAQKKARKAMTIQRQEVHLESLQEFPAFTEHEFPAACSSPSTQPIDLETESARPSFLQICAMSPPTSTVWGIAEKKNSVESEENESPEPTTFALDDFLLQARVQRRGPKQRKKKKK